MWKKRMWEDRESERLRHVRGEDREERRVEKRRRNGKRTEDWEERSLIGEVYWESDDSIEDPYENDDSDDAA